MSTLTGGTLNLIKPELTDDHKVTIGTDLPANFQKVDDEFSAHLAEGAQENVHGLGFKGCLIKRGNASISIPNNTNTIIPFDTEVYDTDGFWDALAPSKIVIPAKISRVRLAANGAFADNTTGYRAIQFIKNGANFDGLPIVRQSPPAGNASQININSAVLSVVEGDYFELRVMQTSGGALDYSAGIFNWVALEVIE